MALKLVRSSNKAPEQPKKEKSRGEYLVACLRDEQHDPKYTDWERNFIASVAKQVDQGRKLSERQIEIIERIWDK
ncbi:MAG: hypothetical protein FJ145_21215 [Deltaproteobacteria bacterium]|nr:hypothetical protein [Deltaproteobacteria bacterium]